MIVNDDCTADALRPWMATPCIEGGSLVQRIGADPPPYQVSPDLFPELAHCSRSTVALAEGGEVSFRWKNWAWQTSDPQCNGPPHGAYNSWCTAFENRSLLFIGDSITHQMVVSLIHLLAHNTSMNPATPRHLNRGFAGNILRACKRRTSIMYVRNDYACDPAWATDCRSSNNSSHGTSHVNSFAKLASLPWLNADTIVLNAGLHMLPAHTVQRHARLLARWLSQRSFRNIVWRTGVPGHANCIRHNDEPLRHPYAPPVGHRYGWDSVAPHDALRREIFEQELPGRVQYLDAATISDRRADRHLIAPKESSTSLPSSTSARAQADCLHYCLPGPPDDWNRVLRAILLGA